MQNLSLTIGNLPHVKDVARLEQNPYLTMSLIVFPNKTELAETAAETTFWIFL